MAGYVHRVIVGWVVQTKVQTWIEYDPRIIKKNQKYDYIICECSLTYGATTVNYGCHGQVADVTFVWKIENNLSP